MEHLVSISILCYLTFLFFSIRILYFIVWKVFHSSHSNFENTIFIGWKYKKGVVSSLKTNYFSQHLIYCDTCFSMKEFQIHKLLTNKLTWFKNGGQQNFENKCKKNCCVDLKDLDILFLLCLLFLFPSPSRKHFCVTKYRGLLEAETSNLYVLDKNWKIFFRVRKF